MQPAIDEVALEMQTAVTNLRLESAMPPTTRRLIEDWLPINEISIAAIRERAGAVPNPAPHQIHVWWARRPLDVSRAAVAGALLSSDADRATFCA